MYGKCSAKLVVPFSDRSCAPIHTGCRFRFEHTKNVTGTVAIQIGFGYRFCFETQDTKILKGTVTIQLEFGVFLLYDALRLDHHFPNVSTLTSKSQVLTLPSLPPVTRFVPVPSEAGYAYMAYTTPSCASVAEATFRPSSLFETTAHSYTHGTATGDISWVNHSSSGLRKNGARYPWQATKSLGHVHSVSCSCFRHHPILS